MNTQIPVLLLTGYLGSGKTTLLNRILNNRRGMRFAVIVNDIGEINIDAELVRKGGIVGGADNQGDLVALQNGCICCTLQTDLIDQLTQLASDGRFDYIVLEASGICDPAPIAQTICSIASMLPPDYTGAVPVLDCIVTVVDALRMKSEFGCGEKLAATKPGDEDIESLVIQQIEFCNVILLNKISEVTPDEGARISAIIRALQPQARIIECDYADIDLDLIVGTGMFDFEDVATSAAWIRHIEHRGEHPDEHHHHHHCHGGSQCTCGHHHHHHHEGEAGHYGIDTMVYYRRAPFDLSRFDRFIATQWPENIIRTKGILYFAHNRDMSYLFEQAGVQKKLTEAGLWYATAPEHELQRMMAADATLRMDWDETYGDRMIKLVFIGRDLDREALAKSLDNCLSKF